MTINLFIRKQFLEITQTELKVSEIYSQSICEKCFTSTRDLALFRTQLIQNQKIIENFLTINVETSSIKRESGEEKLCAEEICKQEPEESSEVYYEEHLDQDFDEHRDNQLKLIQFNKSSDKKTKGRSKLCSGEAQSFIT